MCLYLSGLDECGNVRPGFWKCNTSVLHDFHFKADLYSLWQSSLQNLENIAPDIWDRFKLDVKKLIIAHSKRLNISFWLKYKELQKDYFKENEH